MPTSAQADEAGFVVAGTVRDSAASAYADGCVDLLAVVDGDWSVQDSVASDDLGRFSFSAVAAGDYTVTAAPCSPSDLYLPVWFGGLDHLPDPAIDPVLTVSGDVSDLSLTLRPVVISALTAPSVIGQPVFGATLTADPGSWSVPGLDFSYQWTRNGAPIADETSASHLVGLDDLDTAIAVTVVAGRPGFTAVTAASTPIGPIDAAVIPTVAVTIAGLPAVGRVITATVPAGYDYEYAWKRGAITVATTPSYTLVAADAGVRISLTVVVGKPGFTTATYTASTAPVSNGTQAAYTPTITGSLVVGSTLTAAVPAGRSYTYQWRRNGVVVAKAVSRTYFLTAADAGRSLSVATIASVAGYNRLSRVSASTAAVKNRLTAAPTPKITGSAVVGGKLVASVGVWGPSGVVLSYAWKRDGVSITKATASSYTPTPTDRGHIITLTVTGAKSGYASVAKTSAPTGAVLAGTISYAAKLSGVQKVGNTISAAVSGVKPSGVALTYQWYRNGVAIPGATTASRALKNVDGGTVISVRVTAAKAAYTTKTATLTSGSIVKAAAATTKTGWLKVGVDIKAGTYYTGNTSFCRWWRTKDGSGTDASILGFDYGAGRRMMTIKATDAYVYAVGCGAWFTWDGTAALKTRLGPGVWVAGVDFKLGVYESTAIPGGDGCMAWGMTGITGIDSEYISSADFGTAGPYRWLAVPEEKFFSTDGCTSWVYTGPQP